MTKKKTTIVEEPLPDEESIASPVPVSEQEEELDKIIANLGVNLAKCAVHRYERGKSTPPFIGVIPPADCNEENIQATFGGGIFVVKFLDPENVYLRSKTLHIAGPWKDLYKPVDETGQPTPPAQDPAISMVQMQMESMRLESKNQQELLLKIIDKLGTPPPERESNVQDMAAMWAMMKETIRPEAPSNASDTMKGLIDVIKLGIEIGNNGGQVPTEKGWPGLLKDAVTALPGVLSQLKAPAAQLTPEQAAQQQMITAARGILDWLKPCAVGQHDPGVYIDMAMQNRNDPKFQPMFALLNYPFESIMELDKELTLPHYRPWFENLYNGLRNALQAEISGEADSERAEGDAGSAQSDESAGI